MRKTQKKSGEPLSEEEIEETHFRVCCIHPVLDIENGAIELQSKMNRLCGHGHGMTIREMNENLIWKGQPYVRIPYCKYCYNENTIGVFDDTAQILGWVVHSPTKENPEFRLKKSSKQAFERIKKTWEKRL